MTDLSILQASGPSKIKSRSMGVKLIVVCALALLMLPVAGPDPAIGKSGAP